MSGHVADVACAGSLRYIICIVNCEPSDQQPGSSVGRATCPQGYDPGSSPSGLKMCIADDRFYSGIKQLTSDHLFEHSFEL